MLYHYVCPQCQQPFSRPYKNAIYCSRACVGLVKNKKVTLICQWCGVAFQLPPSMVQGTYRRKHCSQACAYAARPQRYLIEPCQYCGETIQRPVKQAEKWPRGYCGVACRDADFKRPEAERFWEKVRICEHGKWCKQCCWPWQAGTSGKGKYGSFKRRVHGALVNVSAHTYAWETVNGPMPEGLQGNHICIAMPLCCNPAHVYAGTRKDNWQDALLQGRAKPGWSSESTRGHKNGRAKLTEDDVRAIRYSEDATHSLAERYQVSMSMIRAIKRHTTWQHLAWEEGEPEAQKAPKTPLTPAQIRTIRTSAQTLEELAACYHVSTATIRRIKRGITHKDI